MDILLHKQNKFDRVHNLKESAVFSGKDSPFQRKEAESLPEKAESFKFFTKEL